MLNYEYYFDIEPERFYSKQTLETASALSNIAGFWVGEEEHNKLVKRLAKRSGLW